MTHPETGGVADVRADGTARKVLERRGWRPADAADLAVDAPDDEFDTSDVDAPDDDPTDF
jgi:hypothetical protein